MDSEDDRAQAPKPTVLPGGRHITDHAQRLARAAAGEGAAFRELLVDLRPKILFLLGRRYPGLLLARAQLLDAAESLLMDWILDGNRLATIQAWSAWGLASRLLAQVAKAETRRWGRAKRLTEGLTFEAQAEAEIAPARWDVEALDLQRALDRLPEPHRATLLAQANLQLTDAPPRTLAERLGISAVAARQRLARARAFLVKRTQRQDNTNAAEDDDGR